MSNDPPLESASPKHSLKDEDMQEQEAHSIPQKAGSLFQQLEKFLHQFEEQAAPEEKLRLSIDFMRTSLSQPIAPFFKGFWEARQMSLALFKENLSSVIRVELWKEYKELCEESHRLKQVLDEQSAFAVEQIEIAIQAMEESVSLLQQQWEKIPLIELPPTETLKEKEKNYQEIQRELTFLNAQASRINALRKELIKTEIRIRQKNKFFRRLSALGDLIFPKRKELIKNLSAQFLEDVEQFAKYHFNGQPLKAPLYFYREEIKALQNIAKMLTLNTFSFTQTRAKLSECWDKIKELDKQRKKVRAEYKMAYQQNIDLITSHIESFREWLLQQNDGFEISEANQKAEEIFQEIQKLELGREDRRLLRDGLNEASAPLTAKIRAEEEKRSEKEKAIEQEKKEQIKAFKDKTHLLLGTASTLTAEEVVRQRDTLLEELQASSLLKAEKQSFERSLKPLRDLISEKREQTLLSLSESDLQSLEQLRQILKERKERHKEIKQQLEEWRKASGSSGLNFEKAMTVNELVTQEKERLEKTNASIEEIEEKIAELEGLY